ncbi:rod shape-determining protein MreC [Halarcobacter bivalviorum]|uniref:rod shape-determining protein MreC n=1 Tax=Halarcobacter bivalviorum TaxID=663364 RepID=UPI00100A2F1A|nr:rod shape-determining protein MreC [Halarcobacter bivalviorum]RXK04973.1 rod shape-determining protein MreC [Halarcobacter bivalviorum]
MNKFLFFLLFIAVSLGYIFEIDQLIARNFNPLTTLKKVYVNNAAKLQNNIERYFNQAATIAKLQTENATLTNYKELYLASNNELHSVLEAIDANKKTEDDIKFTKVLSYVRFDDFTKVWIDYKKEDDSILGVISNGFAAGIVVNQDGKAKALLNGNDKCNYSIFVGEEKAPGIIHKSKNRHHLVAKYIPIWYNIKLGDEVITSGMDNIFFEGLKVGKVVKIKKMQDMQKVEIEPYAKVLRQKYFFVYKNKELKEEEPLKEEKSEASNKKP